MMHDHERSVRAACPMRTRARASPCRLVRALRVDGFRYGDVPGSIRDVWARGLLEHGVEDMVLVEPIDCANLYRRVDEGTKPAQPYIEYQGTQPAHKLQGKARRNWPPVGPSVRPSMPHALVHARHVAWLALGGACGRVSLTVTTACGSRVTDSTVSSDSGLRFPRRPLARDDAAGRM